MKLNLEIDDDSKFLQGLAQDMEKSQAASAGDQAGRADFALPRKTTEGFSCVAVSCNA